MAATKMETEQALNMGNIYRLFISLLFYAVIMVLLMIFPLFPSTRVDQVAM